MRKVFKNTDKYQRSLNSAYKMKLAIKEWQELDLGEIKWPYKATNFDQYIRKINSLLEKTSLEKDNQVMEEVKKFRRIKEINMLRNDYIESLLVEFNNFIMPTLSNRKGVDFYIDGVMFDQKVSKSVTEQFKTDYKEEYKKVALTNPEIVAKYLYMYQDEERFDAGPRPRLYVVYLNEDINPDEIRDLIKNVNLKKPIPISFSFDHSKSGKKEYNTICQIIILSHK